MYRPVGGPELPNETWISPFGWTLASLKGLFGLREIPDKLGLHYLH